MVMWSCGEAQRREREGGGGGMRDADGCWVNPWAGYKFLVYFELYKNLNISRTALTRAPT